MNIEQLRWKKYPVLNDGFICLVDVMGDDSAIVQAARVSYGKDERLEQTQVMQEFSYDDTMSREDADKEWHGRMEVAIKEVNQKDRNLIRYLLSHSHTTPFEMVEFKFLIRIPMDAWRQMVRHRTANINEYSTRYTEAIDSCQTTSPGEWRLQAKDNKQGSSGFLEEWPEGTEIDEFFIPRIEVGMSPGEYLTQAEEQHHGNSRLLYEERLRWGVAKEQARKDLPLSTYTEAYWKCDLHNIFNFLRLRMDSHAQLEIRSYANAMFEIVKQVCPVACEAFEDYVLHAKKFSRMEMEVLKQCTNLEINGTESDCKPLSMTDREWKQFQEKLA